MSSLTGRVNEENINSHMLYTYLKEYHTKLWDYNLLVLDDEFIVMVDPWTGEHKVAGPCFVRMDKDGLPVITPIPPIPFWFETQYHAS
tara:strand:- start:1603 stop:1866 length:264 start_codon:yes stop_codon:yes gene_type:complete